MDFLLDDEQRTQLRKACFAAVASRARAGSHFAIVDLYRKGDTIQPVAGPPIAVKEDAVLVFVDERPGANWGHPCLYAFHHPKTFKLVQWNEAFFPPARDLLHKSDGATPRPVAPPSHWGSVCPVSWATVLGGPLVAPPGQRRFAVLLTTRLSTQRHYNDVEFLWRTLIDVYGFDEDDVHVLCNDGTLPPDSFYRGDGSAFRMKITGAGDHAGLKKAFEKIAAGPVPIKDGDLLLIHTNSHGSPKGITGIDENGTSETISLDDFGALLNSINVSRLSLVTMMQQCCGGAFEETVLRSGRKDWKRVFTAAAPSDRESAGGWPFNPFTRAWVESLAGGHPDGTVLTRDPDSNDSGLVSLKEAFEYAVSQNIAGDQPVYRDVPGGCGASVRLGTFDPMHLVKGRITRILGAISQGMIPIAVPHSEGAHHTPGWPQPSDLLASLVQLAKCADPSNSM